MEAEIETECVFGMTTTSIGIPELTLSSRVRWRMTGSVGMSMEAESESEAGFSAKKEKRLCHSEAGMSKGS